MCENPQTKTTYKCRNDMLSNLPDSIISHILSFLPTKNAVATSILSTRWKSLWMYIHSVRFIEGNPDISYFTNEAQLHKFSHFLSRVLFLLKSNSIDNFSLKMDGYSDTWGIFVSTWFTVAITKNLKVLNLHVYVEDHDESYDTCISIPACLYTSKTIEVLKLQCILTLNVPNYVCLPNLTTLKLAHVKYSSEDSLRWLLSGCPSLESLKILRDVYDDVKTFTIDSPTLKNLEYGFFSRKGRDYANFKLVLNAPALKVFQVGDDMSDFSIENLCSVDTAFIFVYLTREEYENDQDAIDDHYKRVVKLIQGALNMKHLWISGDTLEELSHVPAPQEQTHYLRHSKVTMGATYYDCNSLRKVLERSEKHDLYLSKDSSDFTHVVRWKNPEELPICLLSCLETISVNGFK